MTDQCGFSGCILAAHPPTILHSMGRLRPGDQPLPVRNDEPAIQPLVIKDLEERMQLGIQRYGTLLQANNGRDMLLDAYQEALDLAVYLKGALVERDNRGSSAD